MLGPYRVLDLTDERGLLCGQILGDLGADVIAVEPPGGSRARRIGPFFHDQPHPERSLYWWAHSRNKRSVTLDIEREEGRALLRRLVESAHFFIESDRPGAMARRGLGYDDLAKINPALVYVSITPFGPKAGYVDSDLIVWAAGGPLALTGDTDRPPVRVSVPQAYAHAGAEAAVAALIAHYERGRSGRGQHVDVSAQAAVDQTTLSNAVSAALGIADVHRSSGGSKYGPILVRGVYPAKDGSVAISFFFGTALGPMTRKLMEYVFEAGFCDESIRDKDWVAYVELLMTGQEPESEYARVRQSLEAFTSGKTKAELLQIAVERGLLIAPVATIDEVASNEQLDARGYWQTLDGVRYPGPFAQFSATPIEYRRAPPNVGEHNEEILRGELGLSDDESREGSGVVNDALPLSGVNVLDLTWVMAGPTATRVLADYGATVLRIESSKRIDTGRTIVPFIGNQYGPENAIRFQDINAGKLGMTLDLRQEDGRAVFLDLVRWADVVVESFSPKVMRGWGLDYESLRKVKPEIVMLSTCLMGQSGPMSQFAGFGSLAAAISGFYDVTGWPDRPPAGPFGAYTDTIAPRFTAIAILAALDYQRRTGRGQYIDQSQAESALHFLGPALLDYEANGRVQTRAGNVDPQQSPHGVYPAAGDDAWVAIAVETDEQWRALCAAFGRPELAADKTYVTAAERIERRNDVDAIVAQWTHTRDMFEIERTLQSRGVPAHAVQNSNQVFDDPQLAHRGQFVQVEHAVHGPITIEQSHFRLSRTPARVERPAPMLGEYNFYVLSEILGYDEERIASLVAAGVLE